MNSRAGGSLKMVSTDSGTRRVGNWDYEHSVVHRSCIIYDMI